jgi:hypothetical protein
MLLEQYSKLMTIVPEIEVALEAKGEKVARPVFDNNSGGDDGEDDEAEEQGDGRKSKRARARVVNGDGNRNGIKKEAKKNFEATSDEEAANEASEDE